MSLRSGLLAACLALAAAAPLRADDVIFTFYGEVTNVHHGLDSSGIQEGDSFVLTLDFTPGGPTPAFGYCLAPGTDPVSPKSFATITPGATQSPPFVDTLFSDPGGYSQTCTASMALNRNTLTYSMRDQATGVWGSVTVGADFPAAWFANPADPLPGNVSTIGFAAAGSMHFNLIKGGVDLSGNITRGEVGRSEFLPNPAPAPEPASLALVLAAGPAILRRRRA
jgi:hypothetical protein